MRAYAKKLAAAEAKWRASTPADTKCTCGHTLAEHPAALPSPCQHGWPAEVLHPKAIDAAWLEAFRTHSGCRCRGFAGGAS